MDQKAGTGPDAAVRGAAARGRPSPQQGGWASGLGWIDTADNILQRNWRSEETLGREKAARRAEAVGKIRKRRVVTSRTTLCKIMARASRLAFAFSDVC